MSYLYPISLCTDALAELEKNGTCKERINQACFALMGTRSQDATDEIGAKWQDLKNRTNIIEKEMISLRHEGEEIDDSNQSLQLILEEMKSILKEWISVNEKELEKGNIRNESKVSEWW